MADRSRFPLNSSQLAAIGLAAAFLLYFVVRGVLGDASEPPQAQQDATPRRLPQVVVRQSQAVEHPTVITARAQTEAARAVVARAETAGRVTAAPATEGGNVARGDLLCQLDVNARDAALAQATALMEAARLTYEGSVTLAARGHRSDTQVAQDRASYDAALAARKQAQVERANVDIRAPFDGRFDERNAEVGDFLAPGAACGTVVELDPILIVANLSERDLAPLALGEVGTVRLATGETLDGRIRFISARADEATGTFRVEFEAPNPEGKVRAGVTGDLLIQAGAARAHLTPQTTLTLDAAGRIGVRILDAGDVVRFMPVTIADDTDAGVWVVGLPDRARLIVQGQEFVTDGARVDAVADGDAS